MVVAGITAMAFIFDEKHNIYDILFMFMALLLTIPAIDFWKEKFKKWLD